MKNCFKNKKQISKNNKQSEQYKYVRKIVKRQERNLKKSTKKVVKGRVK